jgi:Cys-tRNA(Pro)/Cys-tRNA(Cys) deacylase
MAGRDTPATRAARAAGISFVIHEYEHDPAAESFGLEAATALGVDAARVFKTLVVSIREELCVCVIPVAARLDLRSLGKGATMAAPALAERATGYVRGGISPLGQRRRLPTRVDESAMESESILVSAGRRGLEIELAPEDLVRLTGAAVQSLR